MKEITGNIRTPFFTGLSWLFVTLSGFALVVTLFQNVIVMTLLPKEIGLFNSKAFAEMPLAVKYFYDYVHEIFIFAFIYSVILFASSVGLLKRQNWARFVFVFHLSMGIVLGLVGIFAFRFAAADFSPILAAIPSIDSNVLYWLLQSIIVVLSIGQAILLGWLIKRFLSVDARMEFAY